MAETRAALENRAAKARAVREHQRQIRARALSSIADELARVHARRREVLAAVRGGCQRSRARLREWVRNRRAAAREALNAEIDTLRARERARCAKRREFVKASSGTAAAKRRAALAEQRETHAIERRAELLRKKREGKLTRAEARGESDDEVRQNLEADMVPIFDVVRRQVHARPGRSRTEAFLEWAEGHESEIWEIRDRQAAAQLRALELEHRKAERELARCGGRCGYKDKRKTAAERRQALPEAPF